MASRKSKRGTTVGYVATVVYYRREKGKRIPFLNFLNGSGCRACPAELHSSFSIAQLAIEKHQEWRYPLMKDATYKIHEVIQIPP